MPSLPIDDFLAQSPKGQIWDVRSPNEFYRGHIPGAINLPLFDNEERHQVGLCYRQQGKEAAIRLGLNFVAPKLTNYYDLALKNKNQPLFIHCWRGGMRSQSVASFLSSLNFRVFTLLGGYKSFRNYVLKKFTNPYKLIVLGGLTGSGKTQLLNLLSRDFQIIDLERIANHRGSAFGGLGQEIQPSNEHFENFLAMELQRLDPQKVILVEDESKLIGKIFVPQKFRNQMRNALVIFISVSLEDRLQILSQDYARFDRQELLECAARIKKKLGGDRFLKIQNFLQENKIPEAAQLLLEYYDKTYLFGLNKREPQKIHRVDLSNLDQNLKIAAIKSQVDKIMEKGPA